MDVRHTIRLLWDTSNEGEIVRQVKSKDQIKAEDVLHWATQNLHENLTNIIMNMQNHPRPYFMLIHVSDGYHGKPASLIGTIRNDLLNSGYIPDTKEIVQGERTVDLSKSKVSATRIVLMDNAPSVPMISSSLLRVDNKQSRVNWIYILPPDKPIVWGVDMGEASEFVYKSAAAAKAPIVYN